MQRLCDYSRDVSCTPVWNPWPLVFGVERDFLRCFFACADLFSPSREQSGQGGRPRHRGSTWQTSSSHCILVKADQVRQIRFAWLSGTGASNVARLQLRVSLSASEVKFYLL